MSDFPILLLDPASFPIRPMPEPTEIRAGDTVRWSRSSDRFPPAGGYTLSYVFVGPSSQYTVGGDQVTSGSGNFEVVVPGSATASWLPGSYRWQAYVRDAATPPNRYTVAEGVVEVLPNLETATTGLDEREPDEIILDNIVIMLQGKATADVQEYEINGRRLAYYKWDELVKMRATFEARVRRIRIARGEVLPTRSVGVVFRRGY